MPPVNFVAIDRESMTFLGRGEYGVLWDSIKEDYTSEQIVIGACGNKRTYSPFTDMELRTLHLNTTGEEIETSSYPELLEVLSELGSRIETLPTPGYLYTPRIANEPELEANEGKLSPKRRKETPAKPRKTPTSSKPAGRPKPGSTTARVWDIADALLKDNEGADKKELRALVLAACEKEGINKSTASVQFGKWWGSK